MDMTYMLRKWLLNASGHLGRTAERLRLGNSLRLHKAVELGVRLRLLVVLVLTKALWARRSPFQASQE